MYPAGQGSHQAGLEQGLLNKLGALPFSGMVTASELAHGEQASLGCLLAQFILQPATGLGRIDLRKLTPGSTMIQAFCALAQVQACNWRSATGHVVLMASAVVVFECSSGVATARFLKSSDFPAKLAPFGAVSVRKVTHFRVAVAKEL